MAIWKRRQPWKNNERWLKSLTIEVNIYEQVDMTRALINWIWVMAIRVRLQCMSMYLIYARFVCMYVKYVFMETSLTPDLHSINIHIFMIIRRNYSNRVKLFYSLTQCIRYRSGMSIIFTGVHYILIAICFVFCFSVTHCFVVTSFNIELCICLVIFAVWPWQSFHILNYVKPERVELHRWITHTHTQTKIISKQIADCFYFEFATLHFFFLLMFQ